MPRKQNFQLEVLKAGLFKMLTKCNVPSDSNTLGFHVYPSKKEGFQWQCDIAMKAGKTKEQKLELAEVFANWLNVKAWAHPLFVVHSEGGYLYFAKV